jgi:hypothetical protein
MSVSGIDGRGRVIASPLNDIVGDNLPSDKVDNDGSSPWLWWSPSLWWLEGESQRGSSTRDSTANIPLPVDAGATSGIEAAGVAVVVLRASVIGCPKGPVPKEVTFAILLLGLYSRNELVVKYGS